MGNKVSNIITNTLSGLAILISGASFIFSYYTYKASKEEKLLIVAEPLYHNYDIILSQIGEQVVVPLLWDLTISNNSEKTISIIDIDVQAIEKDDIIMYKNMYNGIFNDETPIKLPININSGESKKFTINIGILCDSNASMIIRSSLNSFGSVEGRWARLFVLKKLLAEKDIDFYGNKASGTFEGENPLTYKVDPNIQQTFILSFITSTQTCFTKEIKLYMQNK